MKLCIQSIYLPVCIGLSLKHCSQASTPEIYYELKELPYSLPLLLEKECTTGTAIQATIWNNIQELLPGVDVQNNEADIQRTHPERRGRSNLIVIAFFQTHSPPTLNPVHPHFSWLFPKINDSNCSKSLEWRRVILFSL